MSYDVYLCDPVDRSVLHTEENHMMHGGTYAVGGTTELWLNITFNYSKPYSKCNFSVYDDLNNKSALEAIPIVERVISELGDDVSDDYWEPTEGNAKRALCSLLTMLKMRPDAIVEVDR